MKNLKSFISSCFGISACFHPAWTIEEHRAQDQTGNLTLDTHDDDQMINYTAKVGYKGLWQECLWNQKVRLKSWNLFSEDYLGEHLQLYIIRFRRDDTPSQCGFERLSSNGS